jgi:hypothetical protein
MLLGWEKTIKTIYLCYVWGVSFAWRGSETVPVFLYGSQSLV